MKISNDVSIKYFKLNKYLHDSKAGENAATLANFITDLKENYVTEKQPVKYEPDYRPINVEYKIENELVAKIGWNYVQMNAITNLDEIFETSLYYMDMAGNWIKIKRLKTYNLINQVTVAIEFRQRARAKLFLEIERDIYAAILAFYMPPPKSKTKDEILSIAGTFWQSHNDVIQEFTAIGSNNFKDTIVALDLLQPENEIMALIIDAKIGQTVQDYIMQKLTY